MKTKLAYHVHIHEAGIHMEPKKVIIPHDEGLENLLVLLGDNNYLATSSHASVLDLTTNADLSKFLDHVTEHPQQSSLINEMCVVAWMEEEVQWYLGLVCKDIGMINIWLNIWNNIHYLIMTFGNIQKLKLSKQFLKSKSNQAELMEFGKHLHQQLPPVWKNLSVKTCFL